MPIVLDDTVVLSDTNHSDVEVSDDEYQDAPEPMEDDDFFLSQNDVTSRSGIQPLLPDDFGDEALAGLNLLRLLSCRPYFFIQALNLVKSLEIDMGNLLLLSSLVVWRMH